MSASNSPHVFQLYFLSAGRVARLCRNKDACVVSLHAGLADLEPGSELTEVALVELDPQESQEEEEDSLLRRESRLSDLSLGILLWV
jgi:hypothetical protein